MSLSNLNQVLLRNHEYLAANSTLLVNLPVDNFINEYNALYPNTLLSYFSTHFESHLAASKQSNCSVDEFSAQYHSDKKHDLLIIVFPKSKAELDFTLLMLAENLTDDARVLVVGENKSGIKSLPKLAKATLTFCNKIDTARHCNLFSATLIKPSKPFVLEEWFNYYHFEVNNTAIKVAALPGVFSQKGLDVGTKVLLEQLPKNFNGNVLDFGCGAGVIATFIAKQNSETKITLVDVSALALASAKKTLEINEISGTFVASNSLSHVVGKFDHIVSNPPFHQGVKTNYQATESFLENIKKHLNNRGSVTIVANSFLKYQEIMNRAIGKTQLIHKQNGFSIYQCNSSNR